jgi:hypothetical protein
VVDRIGPKLAPWLLILAIGNLPAQPAAAATEPQTIRASVAYEYGVWMTFTASVVSGSPIERAAVFYRPEGSPDTHVLIAEVSPQSPGIARATHDLRQIPFPPFSRVEYWWQVDFGDGTQSTTPVGGVDYDDNRMAWQILEENGASVGWVDGDLEFARAALDTTHESLARLAEDLLLRPPDRPRVFIYPRISDLETAYSASGRTWVSGHADPRLSAVLLAVPNGGQAAQEFDRLIPHELAHLAVYQRMGNGYDALPAWLNEGLATLIEISPSPTYRVALDQAVRDRTLLGFESLCAAFPAEGEAALLAYAQSASLVRYLRDAYGVGSLHALLDAYAEGTTCTGGVERVFRRPFSTLEAEWLATLPAAGPASTPILAAGGLIGASLTALVALILLKRRAVQPRK